MADAAGIENRFANRPSFNGTLALDTQIIGHWKRSQTKGLTTIEAILYPPFDDGQVSAGLHEAAQDFASFWGAMRVEVREQAIGG